MPTTVETLLLDNYGQSNIIKELELSADAAAGQAVVSLIDVTDLANNDYIALLPGQETGEILQIASISANNVTFTSNLQYLHKSHQRAVKLFGNQIKVYKAPNVNGSPPDISTYSILGSSVAIDPDQLSTNDTDNAGGTGFWYLFTYYNSASLAETDKSLSEPLRGGGFGDFISEEEVLDEAQGIDKANTALWKVAAKKRAAQSEVLGALASAGYSVPLSYVPSIVKDIAIRIAAGLLLQKNLGTVKPGSAKNGKDKVDGAREDLAKIQLNDVILLDANGNQLTKDNLVSGWPDDTTIDNPGSSIPGPLVTMQKRF